MPETTTGLNLDGGVSEKDYARTLNELAAGMDEYRESQDWCSEFWSYITQTITPAIRFDSYNECAKVDTTTAVSDAGRAAELRNIRGRILAYVGNRIDLDSANRILRGAGLAECTPDATETRWSVQFPSFAFTVTGQDDPTFGVQEKFREFLTSVGYVHPDDQVARVYAVMTARNRIPPSETVPLLGY